MSSCRQRMQGGRATQALTANGEGVCDLQFSRDPELNPFEGGIRVKGAAWVEHHVYMT